MIDLISGIDFKAKSRRYVVEKIETAPFVPLHDRYRLIDDQLVFAKRANEPFVGGVSSDNG